MGKPGCHGWQPRGGGLGEEKKNEFVRHLCPARKKYGGSGGTVAGSQRKESGVTGRCVARHERERHGKNARSEYAGYL